MRRRKRLLPLPTLRSLWRLALVAWCVLLTLADSEEACGDAPGRPDPSAASQPFLPPGVEDPGWPHLRGPRGDGHSPEIRLASEWPASGPPVLWVKELGQGYSSFVAQGDRVYTQFQNLGGQYVVCLAARTGEVVWQYRYDWPFEAAGLYPGPRATPTLAGGKIYFAAPSGLVGCLNDQGKLLWSRDLLQEFDGRGTGFGYACSPAVIDGKVVMPVGGPEASMVALDAEDGALVWKSGDDTASYTPAMVISLAGKRQIIGYLEHALCAFDLQTGKLLWRRKLSQGYDEHSAWPVYSEPYLWFSGPFQAGSQLLKLRPEQEPDLVWQGPILSNDVASSVLVDGALYGFDLHEAQSKAHRPSRGAFRCVDLLTGELRWSNGEPRVRRSSDPADSAAQQVVGHASLIVADGKLVLLNDLGELILARASPEKYEELARATALGGEICWTTPALHGGCLFLKNHSRAVCVYVGEPGLLELDAASTLSVAQIPQGRARDWSALLGVEPEYAMDPPTWRWLGRWLAAGLAILLAAGLVIGGLALLLGQRCTPGQYRAAFCGLSFLGGVLVGAPLSLAVEDFVFTWPVSLYVAFHAVVQQLRLPGQEPPTRRQRWRERLVVTGFLLVCAAYFFACRRLSLVTEWTFLSGFIAALPCCFAVRWLSQASVRNWRTAIAEGLLTMAGFLAFYAAGVALLLLKYDVVAT
ncbi:outer membrane protein assembly factor BamB family protein [Lignipirellula cremea]|uniref:outer membrane protein assembly factor BamB family protein n=1 Tax=Lignipirellula cremea TaxID=2528010 RepID=UPI0018D24BFF|nr:PQQ-binding-like beta-propeller repeat protein [Lignipirellula cremea]